MIGGEHRKERFSERLEKAQNQPKNRGYLPGTEVKSGGYTSSTLAGNWFEERADAAYYDGKAVVPTADAKLWTTSYREMVKPVTELAIASGNMASPPQDAFDQQTMIVVVDRSESSYPGHQPHLDAQREATTGPAMMHTVSQLTYMPPSVAEEAEKAFVRPVMGGTPGAQATGVMLRLRRQLELAMPNKSAFPGNVMRSVRLALCTSVGAGTATSGDPVRAEVNVMELQAGLAAVGVEASTPECVALVRFFDKTGNNTANVSTFVDKLRGELTDRRKQLISSVYGLLTSIVVADASAGVGDGLVRLQRLVQLVDPTQLPDVASGTVSAEKALVDFESQWFSECPTADLGGTRSAFKKSSGGSRTSRGADILVSGAAFLDYFSDVSFEVSGEGDFERLMRNLWHLSGGSGKCENTSCRRLEVVHLNGRVTQEEVKNDLAIKGSNDAPAVVSAIRANLEKQGIKDVKSFRVL